MGIKEKKNTHTFSMPWLVTCPENYYHGALYSIRRQVAVKRRTRMLYVIPTMLTPSAAAAGWLAFFAFVHSSFVLTVSVHQIFTLSRLIWRSRSYTPITVNTALSKALIHTLKHMQTVSIENFRILLQSYLLKARYIRRIKSNHCLFMFGSFSPLVRLFPYYV